MPAVVHSAFNVAFWLVDMAVKDEEHLQPQKLQRLLFLAQAWYGAVNSGRRLMPATFVADEMGPIEPNVYLAFSKGCPDLDIDPLMPTQAESFLDGLWRRFAHHSTDHLTRMTKQTPAYRDACRRGVRAEIGFDAMCRSFAPSDDASPFRQFGRQKVMITQTGRPVVVRSWTPGTKT